jgi:hypothetical protein
MVTRLTLGHILKSGAVAMDDYYCCPKCGDVSCPICGSLLTVLHYKGNDPEILALTKKRGFRYFVGCRREELHDKIIDGVNYRGKAFVIPFFYSRRVDRCSREC